MSGKHIWQKRRRKLKISIHKFFEFLVPEYGNVLNVGYKIKYNTLVEFTLY